MATTNREIRWGANESGRADCEMVTRVGAGELSLVEPIGPPPSVVLGRGNGPEVTPARLGLSSQTAL